VGAALCLQSLFHTVAQSFADRGVLFGICRIMNHSGGELVNECICRTFSLKVFQHGEHLEIFNPIPHGLQAQAAYWTVNPIFGSGVQENRFAVGVGICSIGYVVFIRIRRICKPEVGEIIEKSVHIIVKLLPEEDALCGAVCLHVVVDIRSFHIPGNKPPYLLAVLLLFCHPFLEGTVYAVPLFRLQNLRAGDGQLFFVGKGKCFGAPEVDKIAVILDLIDGSPLGGGVIDVIDICRDKPERHLGIVGCIRRYCFCNLIIMCPQCFQVCRGCRVYDVAEIICLVKPFLSPFSAENIGKQETHHSGVVDGIAEGGDPWIVHIGGGFRTGQRIGERTSADTIFQQVVVIYLIQLRIRQFCCTRMGLHKVALIQIHTGGAGSFLRKCKIPNIGENCSPLYLFAGAVVDGEIGRIPACGRIFGGL